MGARFVLLLTLATTTQAAEPIRITVPLRLDRTAIAASHSPAPDGAAVSAKGIAQTMVPGGSVAVEVNGLPYVVQDAGGQLQWTQHYRIEGELTLGPCRQHIDIYGDSRFQTGKSFEFCGQLFSVEAIAADGLSITFEEVSKFTAKVGQPAPAIALPLMRGGLLKLSEKRMKPLLLDFWASWCDVCLGEFPRLRKLHDSSSVEVVSINIDNPAQRQIVNNILADQKPHWSQVVTGEGEGTSAWQVFEPLTYAGGMPLYVLIDTGGVIRYAGTGGGIRLPEVHAALEKLLRD